MTLKAFVIADFNVVVFGDEPKDGVLPVTVMLGALDSVVEMGTIFR